MKVLSKCTHLNARAITRRVNPNCVCPASNIFNFLILIISSQEAQGHKCASPYHKVVLRLCSSRNIMICEVNMVILNPKTTVEYV